LTYNRPTGRFAPSPTGPLHFGSLIAATASYLDVRARDGKWKIRIDDLDSPRTVPSSIQHILETLELFGFEWDDEVIYQSQRLSIYEDAISDLTSKGFLFDCACSRKEIAEQSTTGPYGPIYPGTCRSGIPEGRKARSIRCLTADELICIDDRLQGHYCQNLARDLGDFVIRRADGIVAYQLATVLDDHAQGINEVVRGSDLLDSTPRQVLLQRLLGLDSPSYLHLPIAVTREKLKLSKQTRAQALDPRHKVALLAESLAFLGQPTPTDPNESDLHGLWSWALKHWNSDLIPPHLQIVVAGQKD
jgi:glutamyl-Q tRNA(Asp) synthetase